MNRDSSVRIASGYRLDGRGLIPDSETNFFFSTVFKPTVGVHTTSYPIGAESFSPGVKRLGRETVHSHPSNAEVKNDRTVDPITNIPSWHSA
jgi:hypothetical protein